mmetsp:Transcript_78765/g.152140  ORF Transcript_78765/g.152140 Transcript_78765/m.152140 type:complete len:121 (-) Transcript_78765:302-664(-)
MAYTKRSSSFLLLLLLCSMVAALCLGVFKSQLVFTGGSYKLNTPARSHHSGVAVSVAGPDGIAVSGLADSSAMLLAESLETIPIIAFLISTFLGIIGYSTWLAFGPASEDLRDPFEEHED